MSPNNSKSTIMKKPKFEPSPSVKKIMNTCLIVCMVFSKRCTHICLLWSFMTLTFQALPVSNWVMRSCSQF